MKKYTNCILIYYTGTFNTRYLTKLLQKKLVDKSILVTVYEIDPLKKEIIDLSSYDLIGLGYPIYGFNAPLPFLRFIKRQSFPSDADVFIYKNSGETYHANDASSISILKILKKNRVSVRNEYHFIFPYNIHFRFDEGLICEMLKIDDMLLDILVQEVTGGIPNIKKYRLIHRLITFFVKLQFIGGNINSFFYKVDRNKCSKCGLCIKNCPVKNIYIKNSSSEIAFYHRCLMCMRCSLYCPKNAISIGLFDSWRVNGPYNFDRIREIHNEAPVITDETVGFFSCYKETYAYVRKRHRELFGSSEKVDSGN